MINLESARKICEAASPGPWVLCDDEQSIGVVYHEREPGTFYNVAVAWQKDREDSEFIAFARTALPECLEEIDSLRTENASLRAEVQVARERLGPAGYKLLQELKDLRTENERLKIELDTRK